MGENLAAAAACTLVPLAPPLHNQAAMRTRAALLLCLLPSFALGQVITISESSDTRNGGRNDGVINLAECRVTPTPDEITLTWTLDQAPASDTWYKVYAMKETCPAADGTVPAGAIDLTVDFQATQGSTSGQWPQGIDKIDVVADILGPLSVVCGTTIDINLCVTVYDNVKQKVLAAHAQATLPVDGTVPAAPIDVVVGTGDGRLHVSWTGGSGGATAATYTATATPAAAQQGCNAGGAPGSCTTSGGTSCDISGLTNSACYDVSVTARSAILNTGPASDAVLGIPLPVEDFWRRYLGAGGREQGGCGGSADLLALLALAPLASRLRRRRP
jgi:hypothetical protein